MTRRFLLAFLALVALALPAAAETQYVQDTNDGYLNLRRGPGTQYGIVMRLTAGTEVQGLAGNRAWRQVALPDGTVGWVHGGYIDLNYFPTRRYDFTVRRTNDGYLNLRRGPNTSFGIIRRLHAGQMLFWDGGRSGDWAQLRLPDGTTGWASLKYLMAVN
ncbi:SH3 domain-containing protein [Vannielia litorea]|uniref:Uncharacterized conserved protein YgiM, contains N-terminal SH3 domain, DUF1202 family n=1 Tax=Vannielia litorea TaxID=1217970 RepID=A0A1N6ICS4_9RHOB|nr:SH3 domain-containing protein [Vannielia litorea]SIO29830.1 Uncharacterized conserved protein YgiM, contains N-terminal SH3 domain, DUF1202 family [Vannielia litorea]